MKRPHIGGHAGNGRLPDGTKIVFGVVTATQTEHGME